MVIQDAVDAAASGDTIQIGPGRYDEGQIVETAGWTGNVRVLIHQNELTLIGAGQDATIIGPEEPWDYSQDDDRGVQAGPYFGSLRVWVSGIGFENMWKGISFESVDGYIDSCCFFGNNRGVFDGNIGGHVGGLRIEGCYFHDMAEDGFLLLGLGLNTVQVLDCDFEMAEDEYGLQRTAQFDGTNSVIFDNCRFLEGKRGLHFSAVSSVQISNCSFLGQSHLGLGVSSTNARVSNCSFEDQGEAIFVTGGSELRVQDTSIVNVSQYSFNVDSFEVLQATNCILAHGPEYTIRESSYCDKSENSDPQRIDMRNNDWGTNDAETIASWIHTCDYVVDFIPFIGQPVPTEPITLDGLKAWYR